jgi:formylglycine-generating enzyme required for sulfatase activity
MVAKPMVAKPKPKPRRQTSKETSELASVRQRTQSEVVWVRIEGGSFQMGSDDGGNDEKPRRRVTVPTFELGMTEVTVGHYRRCVDAGRCSPPDTASGCNWGQPGRDDHPVNCVDWSQASAFAAWAEARLPSEAEWEYAARSGGRDQAYPWGDALPSCRRAIMSGDVNGCGAERTWPVCSKAPGNSAQGVCDLAGNVREWVADWLRPYAEAPTDGSANTNVAGARAYRGGAWHGIADSLRAAYRNGVAPERQFNHLGFRLVR